MKSSKRMRVIKTLVSRDMKSTLYGLGFYSVLSITLLISSLVLKKYLQTVQSNGILISPDPLNYPLYLSVLVGSLYLALTSTIAIPREREEGTLQTLFFCPVDEVSYLLGKYFQQMLCYIIFLSVSIVYLLFSSVIINFAISFNLIKLTFLFIFLGSCIISFGIFLSTLTKNVKTSVILFIAIMILFVGAELTNSFLMGMDLKEVNGIILYLRKAIEVINSFIELISPFSYLTRGFEAVRIGNFLVYNISLLTSIVYSIVLLSIATWIFKCKGVGKK